MADTCLEVSMREVMKREGVVEKEMQISGLRVVFRCFSERVWDGRGELMAMERKVTGKEMQITGF